MWLGAHIGISDGLAEAPRQGRTIGCDAIQIFSKSPQMWAGPPIADEAAAGFRAAVREVGLKATAVHHGYLINLASPKKAGLARSRKALLDEIERATKVGVDGLILHPGAHMGEGPAAGLARIIESLNWALAKSPDSTVRLLLENAAGQGTALCATFPELRTVLDGVAVPSRVGVALDTCHLFAAGNEFRTPETYGAFVDRLDSELGVREVRAFHLNDAKADLGSHLDRHENIGKGKLGVDGFRGLLNDARWASTPGYLETPLADDDYAAYVTDLATLRGLLTTSTGAPEAGAVAAPRESTSRSRRVGAAAGKSA
ncbi:MAG: deoxyribonuclease IV [Thermoplasmata archaeon]|nr:deoxyribonuclease IV [Thermoplasmata archaeon]MCI4361888.1 deoxyribonuclease IV [Thermoplasmata archaeon]